MPVLDEVEKVAKQRGETPGQLGAQVNTPIDGCGDVFAIAEHQMTSLGPTTAGQHPVRNGQNHHKTTISTQ